MNAALLHLAVNHAPLFLMLVAAALLLAALVRRNGSLLTAALWMVIVAGAGALLAQQSGEAAEHLLDGVAGIDSHAIEEHEESATAAVLATIVTAGIGIGTAVGSRWWGERFRWRAAVILLLATLASVALIGITAHKGGLIRHGDELENRLPVPSSEPEQE
ncbi:MAG: hypothetical protein N3B17_04525 [Chlorobi bacterium]|jgi:hypothetical protein|nr:hypothetical protein [Chlorobiota bacterium]